MTRAQCRRILRRAKQRFLQHDTYLLHADVNERSLTHKFAEHLQAVIGRKWAVDCEYNRYGLEAKILIGDIKRIVGPYTRTDATDASTVFPDIIVHRRGPPGPNLIVIEAKKNASATARQEDCQKLAGIRAQYGYSYAVFINFLTQNKRVELDFQ
jgi:hypothetical protein